MIGRADIEKSKSNVAMNAWLPQASYPCGHRSMPTPRTTLRQVTPQIATVQANPPKQIMPGNPPNSIGPCQPPEPHYAR
ncbi:hypothetical protein VOLCADRAFT_70807 [Volvox carteri f. nagariensis]|uniref:Uncharacterized protein n=1 Tax=Volvox carteri f. nagariensis TaxID=3068 RepID=D8UL20_VOLCA|nr:hypothetical protein VOLCADRAFT_70807 [Volvox carteri f. nagariensis]|eukprot:XP_002959356.1 hypothetical protein VOLCADRAFT_70807 [Volvox carteri f. nagariensis]